MLVSKAAVMLNIRNKCVEFDMPLTLRTPKVAAVAVAATIGFGAASVPAPANAYAIDCAILLCLAGGWPSDPVCSAARAEFIRRITPWPIEPPLQIWRCPMGAAYTLPSDASPLERLYKAVEPGLSNDIPLEGQSLPASTPWVTIDTTTPPTPFIPAPAVAKLEDSDRLPEAVRLYLAGTVGSGADINISDPAFDFVRSIKVWDLRYFYSHHNRDGCNGPYYDLRLGTYAANGQFRWDRSSMYPAPSWVIPSKTCGRAYRRGVGVEWTDYEGKHGHEWVSY